MVGIRHQATSVKTKRHTHLLNTFPIRSPPHVENYILDKIEFALNLYIRRHNIRTHTYIFYKKAFLSVICNMHTRTPTRLRNILYMHSAYRARASLLYYLRSSVCTTVEFRREENTTKINKPNVI